LATAHKDNALAAVALGQEKLVILRAGKIISTTALEFRPTSVAFSPDDGELAIGGSDNKVHVFSIGSDAVKLSKTLTGHLGRITSVVYDGQFLVSSDANRAIYFWKNGELQNNTGWTFHNAVVSETSFNPSSTVLATCSQDQDILLWSDLSKFEHFYTRFPLAHHLGVDHVNWLNDETIISTGVDRCIKVWSVIKGGFSSDKKDEMLAAKEKEEKKQ